MYRVLVREGSTGFYDPTWFNVVAVSRKGRKVLCRCRTCGHEYTTASTAAHREIESAERFAAKVGAGATAHNADVTGLAPKGD